LVRSARNESTFLQERMHSSKGTLVVVRVGFGNAFRFRWFLKSDLRVIRALRSFSSMIALLVCVGM
jgi:hypothetical protein